MAMTTEANDDATIPVPEAADETPKAPISAAHRFPHDEDITFRQGEVYEARVNNITGMGIFLSFTKPYQHSTVTGLLPKERADANRNVNGDPVYVTPIELGDKPVFHGVAITAQDDEGAKQGTSSEDVGTDTAGKDAEGGEISEKEQAKEMDIAEYACPYCPQDREETAETEEEIRRHITREDDVYHGDRSGSDQTIRVIARDSDGEEIDIMEASDTYTREEGNVKYEGPAISGADQLFKDRPVKETEDVDPDAIVQEWSEMPLPSAIAGIDADEVPDGPTSAENYRRVLALIAQYEAVYDRQPERKHLEAAPAFDYSDSWSQFRLRELCEDGWVERERANGRAGYEYHVADEAMIASAGEMDARYFESPVPVADDEGDSESEQESDGGDDSEVVVQDTSESEVILRESSSEPLDIGDQGEVSEEAMALGVEYEHVLGEQEQFAKRLLADAPTADGEMVTYAEGMLAVVESVREAVDE